jgi:hypothetical protein
MNRLLSVWQRARLRYGLTWRTSVPPIPYRFFFRTTMVAAVVVMVTTNQDLAERVQIMEQVVEVYEAKVAVLHDCERGAVAYHYPDGTAYECTKGKL